MLYPSTCQQVHSNPLPPPSATQPGRSTSLLYRIVYVDSSSPHPCLNNLGVKWNAIANGDHGKEVTAETPTSLGRAERYDGFLPASMEHEVLEVLTRMLTTAAGALRTSDGESKWLEGVKLLHSIPTAQTGDYAGFQVSSPLELWEGNESGVALLVSLGS